MPTRLFIACANAFFIDWCLHNQITQILALQGLISSKEISFHLLLNRHGTNCESVGSMCPQFQCLQVPFHVHHLVTFMRKHESSNRRWWVFNFPYRHKLDSPLARLWIIRSKLSKEVKDPYGQLASFVEYIGLHHFGTPPHTYWLTKICAYHKRCAPSPVCFTVP